MSILATLLACAALAGASSADEPRQGNFAAESVKVGKDQIIHGDKDNVIARENRDKYRKEGHEVLYVEVPGLTHWWTGGDINDRIWQFFADHPRGKK